MEHKQAQTKCGGVIALLEGRQNIQIPDDIIFDSTLNNLEKRLRRLEARFSVLSPPASLDPTWESLALRIYRVQKEDRTPTQMLGSTRSLPNSFLELVPAPSEVTIETLQTLCAEIKPNWGFQRSSQYGKPWPKYANDDDALDVIRQRLCHAAGQTHGLLKKIPYTRSEIYAALVDLTMEPLKPKPALRGPPIPPPSFVKKPCCACCDCACHNRKPIPDDTSSISSSKRERRHGGFLGFMKKLAFWRRPKVISDDASSVSSG